MAATITVQLGELLRLVRNRAGLSQKALGDQIEIGRTTVIRWEDDQGDPRWRDIEAWLDACSAEPDLRNAARAAWEEVRTLGWVIDLTQPQLWDADPEPVAA